MPHTPYPRKGHESIETTQIYLHADLALKEKALARTAPPQHHPADTGRPTPCSPSLKDSEYAEQPTTTTACHQGSCRPPTINSA